MLSLCAYSLWHRPPHGIDLRFLLSSAWIDKTCGSCKALNPHVTALLKVGGALVENPRAPAGFVPKDRSGYQLLNARYNDDKRKHGKRVAGEHWRGPEEE